MRARRFARFALGLAATLVVAGAVRADAPVGQYATFGLSDVCISDVKTQLTWLRTPLAITYKFGDAATQCGNKGPGWRVPSVNELETLVDENPHYELDNGAPLLKAIDANAFPATPVLDPYWTSSVVPGQATAWAVNFQDGSTLTPPLSQTEQVRCVIVTPSTTPAACIPPPQ
jgi:hypothetical protein